MGVCEKFYVSSLFINTAKAKKNNHSGLVISLFVNTAKTKKKSLGLGHHHLAELIKVHRARAVLVQLLQYALKNIYFEKVSLENIKTDAFELVCRERGQKFTDESSQGFCCDVSQTLLVIDPVQENSSY